MRKKWILSSVVAVILLPLLLLVGALVFLSTADLTKHRDYIANEISEIAGRRVSLNGELDLNVSLTPSIVVSDIAIANAPWASEPEMLTIQRLEAEIELLPLLRGDIRVPRFHLQGVTSLVETDPNGLSNWALGEPVDEEVDGDADTTGELKLPWIGSLFIGDVEFAYHDGQTGKQVTAKLQHAKLSAPEPDAPTVIDAVGQVNKNPIEINGTLALPTSLTGDSAAVPIELHVKALGLTADASGTLTGTAEAPGIDLTARANADNLKKLQQVFGPVVPQVRPVKLVMEVKGDQGQPVAFKLNATAGKGYVKSEMTLRRDGPRPNLTGNVDIGDVDVARLWAPLFDEKPGKTAPKKAPTSPRTSSQGLDEPIPLDWLAGFDANVSLSVKTITLPQTRIKSLQGRFIVDDRILKIDELNLLTEAGSLTAGLLVDAQAKQPEVSLELNTTPIALAKLQPLAENKRFANSRAEAKVSLRAQGETVATLINTVQGTAQLDYANPKRKEELSVNLQRKPAEKTATSTRLDVTADGRIEGQNVELRGNIVPPTDLLTRGKPYAIDLAIQALGVSGKIKGTAADPYTLSGLDLGIEAQAADLDGLRRAFGQSVPKIGKTELTARLKSQQSKLQLSKLQIGLGGGRIDGWLTLDTSASIPDLQAELAFSDLNLDTLLPVEDKPAKPKTKSASKPTDDKVFSNEPLPFENLSQANVNATLQANNLIRNNRRLKEAEVKIDLVKGKLSASILKFSSVRGELVGDFVVDASGKGTPTVTIKLKAPHVEVGELLTSTDGTAAIEGPLATDILLKAQGNSLAQIMGSLNGNINLLMEQGSADAKALDMAVGGLTAMFGTIFADKSSKTKINCAIYDFKLEDGMLTPQLAILDTRYSTVFAEGQVDLKKEQLDIKVSPQAKGVTLSVAVPVRLKGTLSKPSVQVEPAGALLKTGELWVTVVYPPAALVKFADLGGGKPNPCVSMVAEKGGIPIVSDVGKAVGGAVKGVGKGVGKIFGGGKKKADTKAAPQTPAETGVDDDESDGD